MGVGRGQRLRGWYRTPEGLCGSALSSAVSGSRQPFEQDVPCGERMGWARGALYCQIHRVEALLPPPGPPECVTRGGLIPPTLCQGAQGESSPTSNKRCSQAPKAETAILSQWGWLDMILKAMPH